MKIIIVGGVAGGATAAARLRRLNEDAEIILFERGEYISYANCGLPYYIGGVIDERENILLQTPESFYGRYRVDVRIKNEVIDIDRDSSQAVIKDLKSGKEYRESYDKILLAPGSKVMVPPVEGISGDKVFTLRGVNDSEKIKDYISEKHPRHALVVGGGYIGLEVAENLRNLGIRVTILEMAGQLVSPLDFEMAAEVHQHLKLKNIEFFLGEQLVALNDEGKSIRAVFKSGVELDTDMAVVSIGIKPEVELARKAGLALGDLNGIKVDKYLRTSDPDIYAAGDAIEAWDPIFKETRPIPLAGPANKQARIAADNIIMGNNSVYKGSVGTAIAKVFDIGVGVTGFSETYLKKKDIEYSTVLIHSASHAGYYPESLPVSVKLNFSLKDGRVLGGQAIGYSGADKIIEILSMACQFGLTIFELKDMDQAYAPPYSSAKSPVNMVGFVAENIYTDKLKVISCLEVKNNLQDEDTLLLDVREKEEVELGKISGSLNIPLNKLRGKLDKINKNKKIYVYCAVGQRGYLACRILMQSGFENVFNVSGGYKTWEYVTLKQSNVEGPKYRVRKDDYIYQSSGKEDETKSPAGVDVKINASGLQCPGPIMKLNKEMENIPQKSTIEITATDPGFLNDVKSWCNVTDNKLIDIKDESGKFRATIRKVSKGRSPSAGSPPALLNDKTMVVFSDSMDKALASFVIANGALSMGRKVTMFFTFWGLNILRKRKPPKVKKDIVSKMFAWVLPKGPSKLALSKLNMFGFGSKLMKITMKKKKVESLESLMEQAGENGIKIIACQMSMDIMGIKKEELIDGISIGGVASYIEASESANMNLFI